MSVYAGTESSRLKQGNVNDNEALTFSSPSQADMQFGGPFFSLCRNFWTATDNERATPTLGAHFSHVFSPCALGLNLNYDYTWSRGLNSYDYASLTAISTVYQSILTAADIGNGFPANIYRHADDACGRSGRSAALDPESGNGPVRQLRVRQSTSTGTTPASTCLPT